jgi:hypothetical protein
MMTEFDALIGKTGGAVLRPENTAEIGLRILSDIKHLVTMAHNFVNDVDFTGMYPNVGMAGNVSKETKISTSLKIEGFTQAETENYHSLVISIDENSVLLGSTYYGLENYSDMIKRFGDHLVDKNIMNQNIINKTIGYHEDFPVAA